MKLLPLGLALIAATVGCGLDSKNTAEQKEIATNLDGETASASTYLYWAKDNNVFQGMCSVMPITFENCQAELKSLPKNSFLMALGGSVDNSLIHLGTKITDLNSAIPALATKIADSSIEVTTKESDLAQKTAQKATAVQSLNVVVANIASLNQQLTAIGAEITANPTNNDLKIQKNLIAADLQTESAKKPTLDVTVQQASSAVVIAEQNLQAQKLVQANLTFEYAAKKQDLVMAQSLLLTAQTENSKIDEVVAKLEQEPIIYRIMKDVASFDSLKPFVKRFKQIFDANAAFSDALVYANMDLLVPSTGTSGTVDFPMEYSLEGKVLDVGVSYALNHTNPASIQIYLISPDGASVQIRSSSSSELKDFATIDGRTEDGYTSKTIPQLASFNSKITKGVWKLRIVDGSTGDTGKLKSVKLSLKIQP